MSSTLQSLKSYLGDDQLKVSLHHVTFFCARLSPIRFEALVMWVSGLCRTLLTSLFITLRTWISQLRGQCIILSENLLGCDLFTDKVNVFSGVHS